MIKMLKRLRDRTAGAFYMPGPLGNATALCRIDFYGKILIDDPKEG